MDNNDIDVFERLLDIAVKDPTKITDMISVLKLFQKYSIERNVIRIQVAIRIWRISRKKRHDACRRIQTIVRVWLSNRRRRRRMNEAAWILAREWRRRKSNGTLQSITAREAAVRIQMWFRRIQYNKIVERQAVMSVLFDFCGIEENVAESNFKSSRSTPAETSSEGVLTEAVNEDEGVSSFHEREQELVDSLWDTGEELNMFCENLQEAQDSGIRARIKYVFDPALLELLLSMLQSNSVEPDTKTLCLAMLHDSDTIVMSADFLFRLKNSSFTNLSSEHKGMFRGSVRVLAEMSHLVVDLHDSSIPSFKKLLSQLTLMAMSERYGLTTSQDFTYECKSRSRLINWHTSIFFDLVRLVQAFHSSFTWDQLESCGYFRAVMILSFCLPCHRSKAIVVDAWNQWPVGDAEFRTALSRFVDSTMSSENILCQQRSLDRLIVIILHGILNYSNCYGQEPYTVLFHLWDTGSKAQAGDFLSFAVRLLENIFVALHANRVYASDGMDEFKKLVGIGSFQLQVLCGNVICRGALASENALCSLIDDAALRDNLKETKPKNHQLVALYVLQGRNDDAEVTRAVSLDEYAEALKRNPETLRGAWFRRRAPPSTRMVASFAHCVAAVGAIDCLVMHGKDLKELVVKNSETLLHTACRNDKVQMVHFLLRKGFSPLEENDQGDNALMIAKRSKNKACFDLLNTTIQKSEPSLDNLVAEIEGFSVDQSSSKPLTTSSKRKKRRKNKNESSTSTITATTIAAHVAGVNDALVNSSSTTKMTPLASEGPPFRTTSAGRTCRLVTGGPTCAEIYVIHGDLPKSETVADIAFDEDTETLSVMGVDGSIADILPQICALSSNERKSLCLQLLRAVHVLQSNGVVHQRITPLNVFYTRTGDGRYHIKLGPMGVEGLAQSGCSQYFDGFFGAHNKHAGRPDARMDVFAVGCVISILMCGHHIFGFDSKDQMLNAEKNEHSNAKFLKKESLECYDLVKRMVSKPCDVESIDQCLSHPIFGMERSASFTCRSLYVMVNITSDFHRERPLVSANRTGA